MEIKDFYDKYSSHPIIEKLHSWAFSDTKHLSLKGINNSSNALVISNLFKKIEKTILVIFDDEDKAAYFYHDLTKILNSYEIAFMPNIYKNIRKSKDNIIENEILRTDSLNKIISNRPVIIVTYSNAIIEKVSSKDNFYQSKIYLKLKDEIDIDIFVNKLQNLGFYEVDFVYEVGQFSQRGSIIDIFSYSNELPYRIDFSYNIIDSIRVFDIEKQISIDSLKDITIVSNIDNTKNKISLFDFLDKSTLLIFNDINYCLNMSELIYKDIYQKDNIDKKNDIDDVLISKKTLEKSLLDFRIIELLRNYNRAYEIEFSTNNQPDFNKNFDIISSYIKDYINKGYLIFIASDSKKQIDRIESIFFDRRDLINFIGVESTLHDGFIDNTQKICFFTDHQIFNRLHKFSLKTDRAKRGKAAILLKELNSLKSGDFVVHYDHGIGEFAGLLKTEINGKQQEVIKLIYKGGDIIFVSISSLHKISKYRGKEGSLPTLSRLGTGAWERLKDRTKVKVKDIARDLIKLYAERIQQKGFEYSQDSYLQSEMESSFLYEDTPDQTKATNDIKNDMQSPKPMDRLVCGDVGFGKTEVAMRASFKAVADNKQVAILVPTTILAFQHYKTFVERFANFPVNIDYISRAKSTKETKKISEDLKNGKIDILIGTHKIVSKDIEFKDLGLLIIDEEQKFGVSIKEKLKTIRSNVDTLTLTATPIPRTLQFSLIGARDLSIINTPPPNRYHVVTDVIRFDEDIIRDAISYEINRNGQIFFINNHIQNIHLIEKKLKNIFPTARIAVAHGQMPSKELEDIIIDFINYEYDILIATTVIESGIDMPNVNTIFINNANNFGLSDLHQLRGRVGRSNKKAYCYLITHDFKDITEDARRRLQAISTFSDLGSGFNIAMQDLDIRGAGNMLGAEQSGFIAELGYETYQKILNEAVEELKKDEFFDVIDEDNNKKYNIWIREAVFESDLDLIIPSDYVSSVSERITLYQKLDSIKDFDELHLFRDHIIDRFGAIPQQLEDLMLVIPIRWISISIGVERIVLKNNVMTLYFVSDNKSTYYQSDEFGEILKYISKNPQLSKIQEINGKRLIKISAVYNIQTALTQIKQLIKN